MARNREKAQSMLYRFREEQMKQAGIEVSSGPRPRNTAGVQSIKACERWRSQVIREMTSKIAKIQDRKCL